MANVINSLNYGNNTYTFTLPYGVCGTAADTAAKEVTVDNFSLETGAVVIVKFTNANSATSAPTLNVNGTGAKPIYRYGTTEVSTGTTTTGWYAGSVQMFTYDGTGWIRDYWNNTTYSNASLGCGYATCGTAAATTAKVGTLSSYSLTTGGIVSVKFTYDVPASATLNINSKGAKNIYYRGAAITAGIIKAGDIATFIYSSQYHLVAIDRWQNDISTHIADTTKHITSTERTNWNAAKTHADSAHAPSNAQANQNAFSNVTVGSTTIAADTTTDTLTLVAGSNITLTPDATNDKITIAATDTVYTHPTTAGNKHIPSGGSSGQFLKWSASGTATWAADNNTKNTAGSTDSSSKLFLIGATSQAANPQTYSHDTAYVGTDGCLYSNSTKVSVEGHTHSGYAASSHNHSASNITSGTLAVARGGTGNSNGYIQIGALSGTTVGTLATAEGRNVTASGSYCHAEGNYTEASGSSAHAEGQSSTASGIASHAEGNNATASGNYSHAEGDFTSASAKGAHAEGTYTLASSEYQHVQGKFNVEDKAGTYAHIVGNGESTSARSNAYTLDWDGNGYYADSLEVNNNLDVGLLITAQSVSAGTGTFSQLSVGDKDEFLEEIGGISMKLLWTNASPTSEFASQGIILNNLSQYDMILVYARWSIDATSSPISAIVENVVGKQLVLESTLLPTYAAKKFTTAMRSINVNSNGLSIHDAVSGQGEMDVTRNGWLVPYKIYGIKGVQ